MKFRVIDGCPCPASISPYIYLILRAAGQTATSIYRGEEARELLHHHGKHTQAEIHTMYPSISNPPGQSGHELRSDAFAYLGPVGRRLSEWEIGVDSGGNDLASRQAIEKAARRYGWYVRHPYSRGVEGHHWCFAKHPYPNRFATSAQIIKLRATLPKS